MDINNNINNINNNINNRFRYICGEALEHILELGYDILIQIFQDLIVFFLLKVLGKEQRQRGFTNALLILFPFWFGVNKKALLISHHCKKQRVNEASSVGTITTNSRNNLTTRLWKEQLPLTAVTGEAKATYIW